MKKTTAIVLVVVAAGAFGLYRVNGEKKIGDPAHEIKKEASPKQVTAEKEKVPEPQQGLKVWTNTPQPNPVATTHESEPPVLSEEELAELTGDDKQSAVVTALADDHKLEQVAEVVNVKCEEKTCTVNLKSKTTNMDPNFQTAMLHFHQANYKWLGEQSSYDPSKEKDGQMLQYTFSEKKDKK